MTLRDLIQMSEAILSVERAEERERPMMLTEHRFTIEAKCPKDVTTDTYNTYVRSDAVIPVEDIIAAVKVITKEPIFQEDITSRLARHLGCEVETHGIHSGVYTTCRYSA